MNKRLNIGVDIDGVLANFSQAAREVCKEIFDGRPDDGLVQTTWAFDSLGISGAEEKLLWKEIDIRPNWWMHLKKLLNTSTLKTLTDTHRVVFITNRKDGTGWPIEQQSAEWLKQHFWLFNPTVLISDKKGPVADGLKLDYYIDDRPKNVQEVLDGAPNCKTFLLRATYNTEYNPALVVNTFDEFSNLILNPRNNEVKKPYAINWAR
jgi:5'(3')-deoxyribonucleotidase